MVYFKIDRFCLLIMSFFMLHHLKHLQSYRILGTLLATTMKTFCCSISILLHRITLWYIFNALKLVTYSWISLLDIIPGINRWSWWNHSGILIWCIFSSQSYFIDLFLWHTESFKFPKDIVAFDLPFYKSDYKKRIIIPGVTRRRD